MTANHRALDAADIALIEKVKLTPSLYDSSSPDFKFAYRKEQLWENVAASLAMKAVDGRRRWTCLRDRYSRELKQMRLHPEKHEYGNNDFFRQMDFLRKFVRKRRERRRIDPKYKYDSSWDGSNDGATQLRSKSEPTTQSTDDMYDETQDQYDAKLEVTTEEAENGYHEFVEDQINESYEEYVEPQSVENAATKYAVSGPAVPVATTSTSRHSASSAGSNAAIPIAFLSNAAQGNNGNNTNYTQLVNKTSPPQIQQKHLTTELTAPGPCVNVTEPEDDYFCKAIGSYLRQLSRRHKIKAKVEMFQILEKYIELEESPETNREERKG